MSDTNIRIAAGIALKSLIKKHYSSQQAFADDFGVELRTISRYVTTGIRDVETIQEIADFFDMDITDYLQMAKQLTDSWS